MTILGSSRVMAGLIVCLFAACREHDGGIVGGLDRISGVTMGTAYHIRFGVPPDRQSATDLRKEVEEILEALEDSMSTWRSDSEISRFNASRSTDWFPVSGDFARVVFRALEVHRETDGAFDITVGPLLRLWGFGAGADDRSGLPSTEEVEAARAECGSAFLEVRLDPPALRKAERPALEVDLSAIAKGYAVDAVAEHLARRGHPSHLVEIGGEVRVGEPKPGGVPWRIGIESPMEDTRSVNRVIELSNTALATSGDYRNFVEIEGVRYSHLVNPRSGRPVPDEGLGSVSVLADSCLEADAMATALFVLGPNEGVRFSEGRNLPVLFLIRRGEEFSATMTNSFENRLSGASWTGD